MDCSIATVGMDKRWINESVKLVSRSEGLNGLPGAIHYRKRVLDHQGGHLSWMGKNFRHLNLFWLEHSPREIFGSPFPSFTQPLVSSASPPSPALFPSSLPPPQAYTYLRCRPSPPSYRSQQSFQQVSLNHSPMGLIYNMERSIRT